MFTSTTQIRIHYALTDQMGVVYHGRFAEFFEIGRSEAIRELGYTYKDIEAMGIIMPVVDLQVKYIRPIRYDDLITVKTILKQLPEDHKITFNSELFDEAGNLLSHGHVTLYFMASADMKKCPMPSSLKNKIAVYF